jgi:hypothetical protein
MNKFTIATIKDFDNMLKKIGQPSLKALMHVHTMKAYWNNVSNAMKKLKEELKYYAHEYNAKNIHLVSLPKAKVFHVMWVGVDGTYTYMFENDQRWASDSIYNHLKILNSEELSIAIFDGKVSSQQEMSNSNKIFKMFKDLMPA